jgi:hypothetical protein
MKNYKKIRRIFETADVAQEMPLDQPAQVEAPQPAQMPAPMPAPTPALPPIGATSAAPDPMTMTVKDFVERLKSLDPLVAMGIESYIEKNMGSFIEPAAPVVPLTVEPDLSFSTQVPAGSANEEPSLDFPA